MPNVRTVPPTRLLPILLTVLLGCSEVAPEAGRVVIVGGGLSAENDAVYEAILEARDGAGPFCVFPTASASPEESMASAVGRFGERAGPENVIGILLTTEDPARADDPEVAERIRSCSGFFFVGGVQSRISQVFRPDGGTTWAYTALMERFREGAVVSGSSAGAAIMSDPMIAGGASAAALEHGPSEDPEADGVSIEGGLGFFDAGFVDQHFLARGRWGRLLVAAARHPAFGAGFGIDENTALVVEGDEAWVAGASGVVVIDARNAVVDGDHVEPVVLWLAGAGDRIDLEGLRVTMADGKSRFEPAGETVAPEDPFERWGLLHLLHHMAATETESVLLRSGGLAIEVTEAPDFVAGFGEGEGVQGTPRGLSAGPFFLSVHP